MDILEDKIRAAEEFRDRYFLDHPGTTDVAEKRKAVKERVLPLLQDIPIEVQGASAQYSLICGRILNITVEYDPECEKHLTQAIKMDPTLFEAWYQLGECLWKKDDYTSAVDCFRKSLKGTRTAKCLCSLSMALRHEAQRFLCSGKDTDRKKADALFAEASELCEEAVTLDNDNGSAWQALGNTLLLQFFRTYQQDFQLMKRAKDCYKMALTKGNEYLNADLHANYATALKFTQDYQLCIEHLMRACKSDPSCSSASEQLQSLVSFLWQINELVRRKGKLKVKRLLNYQTAITKYDLGIYGNIEGEKSETSCKKPNEIRFSDLKPGSNFGTVACGKVVGIVPNPDTVPYTFVGCDKTGTCIAVSIYNCSAKFGLVIGDSFAIPEPYVIDVKVDEVGSGSGNIQFRMVRVTDSKVIAKNGKLLTRDMVAYCEMRCKYTD